MRALRRNAGLTGVELARRCKISQSRISRIETGHLVPQADEVDRLATALGLDANTRAELHDLARAARTRLRSWRALHARGFAEHQIDIARWEQAATQLRLFQPNIIPGLLQTAEYARRAIELSTTDQDIPTAVAARMARQTLLYERAKSFVFLVTEGALRWRIVPTDDHAAQLRQLASLATLANVELGIIPWRAQVAAHQSTMFVLFDDRAAYIEMMNGEILTEDRADVAQYSETFTTLADAASFGEGAIAELDRIASELTRLA